MSSTEGKRAAGYRAADEIRDGMTVGLGTGSTVFFTLERLAERIRAEKLSVRGVPTSVDTEEKARRMGIPLVTLADVERLCPRVLLIDHGRVLFDGALDAIRRDFADERTLRAVFEGEAPRELPEGVEELERGPGRLVLRFRRSEVASAELVAWLAARRPIADLAIEEPPIERIVAGLYRGGLAGRGPGRRQLDKVQRRVGLVQRDHASHQHRFHPLRLGKVCRSAMPDCRRRARGALLPVVSGADTEGGSDVPGQVRLFRSRGL